MRGVRTKNGAGGAALMMTAIMAAATPAMGGEIGWVEDYALGDDREAALVKLVPGTDENFYWRALQMLHTGKLDDAQAIIRGWVNARGGYSSPRSEPPLMYNVRNRHALLAYAAAPTAENLDALRRRVEPALHYTRRVAVKAVNPTALPDRALDADAWRKEIGFTNFHRFEPAGRERIPFEAGWGRTDARLNRGVIQSYLQVADGPDMPGIVDAVESGLRRTVKNDGNRIDPKGEYNGEFGHQPIHSRLTLAQLEELGRRLPKLRDDPNWVNAVFARLAPNADVDAAVDDAAWRATWAARWTFAETLAPVFIQHKINLLAERLQHDRARGIYDRARFAQYMDLPRRVSYVRYQWLDDSAKRMTVNTSAFPSVDDWPWVRALFLHHFANGLDWNDFTDRYDANVLKALYAEAMLTTGQGDAARWYTLFNNPAAVQALKDRVDLDFRPENPTRLAADAPLSIQIDVKNVSTLTVKAFKINTLNWYRRHGGPVTTDIDLDGLVAEDTRELAYTEDPVRRITRTFDFPKLDQPGLYVIEAIGGGRACRAVVRRGALRFLERPTSAGHRFTVLDADQRVVKGAALWVGNQRHAAKPDDESGAIVVPYGTTPGRTPVVLEAGDFADLGYFEHRAETYALDAGFHVDRESLRRGGRGHLLMRPTVTIHDMPVPLAALKNVELRLASADRFGVVSTRTIPIPALTEDGEAVHEFAVPADLAVLSATLTAKIRNLSQQRDDPLEAAAAFAVNGIDATAAFESLHFGRDARGHFLEVLGKSGEPRPARPVYVRFKHREFTQSKGYWLQTDDAGRIGLGDARTLDGIDLVMARIDNGFNDDDARNIFQQADSAQRHRVAASQAIAYWTPGRDAARIASDAHTTAGEPIRIPYAGAATKADASVATLFELRNGLFVRECADALAVKDGYLTLDGLAPGDYTLRLKEGERETVAVRVTAGRRERGYARGASRLLELADAAPPHIVSARADAGAVEFRIANAGPETRVHVFATRYAPMWDAYARLAAPTVGLETVMTPSPASVYLGGRDIGDELRYVLERQAASAYAGVMLPRPGLILQPQELRETVTTAQVARAGEAVQQVTLASPAPTVTRAPANRPARFDADGATLVLGGSGMRDGRSAGGKSRSQRHEMAQQLKFLEGSDRYMDAGRLTAFGGFDYPPGRGDVTAPNLDWRATPSVTVANAKPVPGADGVSVVRVPRAELGTMREVVAVLVDGAAMTVRRVALDDRAEAPRNLRLADVLDPDGHFVRRKRITRVAAGNPLVVADPTGARAEVFATLADLHRLFFALTGSSDLAEFAFVTRWPALTDAEKTENYRQYACHELNFFLYRKDRAFFDAVVKPFIADKREKRFMDHYLLDADLSAYLAPDALARLNPAEKLLLAERTPADAARLRRMVADDCALVRFDRDDWNHIFDTALQRGALDADGPADDFGGDDDDDDDDDDEMVMNYLADDQEALTEEAGTRRSRAMSRRAGAAPDPRPAAAGLYAAPPLPATSAPMAPMAAAEPAMDAPAYPADAAAPAEAYKREDARNAGEGRVLDRKRELGEREEVRQYFRQIDKTKEWAETEYRLNLGVADDPEDIIASNGFWADWAAHEAGTPFLSPRVVECYDSFAATIFALALTDLPFTAPAHTAATDERGLRIDTPGDALVFHEDIEPAEAAAHDRPVLVAQQYFRQNDRQRMVDGETVDHFITDEFLANVVYGGLVAVTNPTGSPQKLSLLWQIPRGAIPVLSGRRTAVVDAALRAYQTRTFEYHFYFPDTGTADHFPAHIARDGDLVAFAPPQRLPVVAVPSTVDRASWAYISQDGTPEETLAYLRERNLGRIDLELVAWRMADAEFFPKALAILRERGAFHPALWGYAFVHGADQPGHDPAALREYLMRHRIADRVGAWLASTPLDVDPVQRGTYRHLEYAPLVHARAHALGRRRQITNDALFEQYHKFLDILAHKPALDDEDKLAAAYYLLLQDRFAEGEKFFRAVNREGIAEKMQYDYLDAWLAVARLDAPAARAIADRRAAMNMPERWRRLFAELAAQLDQAEGRAATVTDADDRTQAMTRLAATAPSMDMELDGVHVTLRHQNLDAAEIRYYRMDLEQLFSRHPFAREFAQRFAYVEPNRTENLRLSPDGTTRFQVPEALRRENVLVEVRTPAGQASKPFFANAPAVRTIESYGQVRVASAVDARPLPRAYVKVYARGANGQVAFHKDGYTDARGLFDYATLSAGGLDAVERFAILVLAPDAGAALLEAAPPRR